MSKFSSSVAQHGFFFSFFLFILWFRCVMLELMCFKNISLYSSRLLFFSVSTEMIIGSGSFQSVKSHPDTLSVSLSAFSDNSNAKQTHLD